MAVRRAGEPEAKDSVNLKVSGHFSPNFFAFISLNGSNFGSSFFFTKAMFSSYLLFIIIYLFFKYVLFFYFLFFVKIRTIIIIYMVCMIDVYGMYGVYD
jgi:hypothetical protein